MRPQEPGHRCRDDPTSLASARKSCRSLPSKVVTSCRHVPTRTSSARTRMKRPRQRSTKGRRAPMSVGDPGSASQGLGCQEVRALLDAVVHELGNLGERTKLPRSLPRGLGGMRSTWASTRAWLHPCRACGHPTTAIANDLKIGTKSWCCTEPERISNALTPSGSFRLLEVLDKQPKIWVDGRPHACVERDHTVIPSRGLTAPSYVDFPIW